MNSRICTIIICFVCTLLFVQAGISATESTRAKGISKSKVEKGEATTDESSLTQKEHKEGIERKAMMEKKGKPSGSEFKEAIVIVPDLTKENVQKSLDILRKFKEIETMKPNFDENLIQIRYKEKLDFDLVIKELNVAYSDVKIKEINQADPKSSSKCGGCPNKAKCEEEEAKKAAESQKSLKTGS